MNVLLVGEFSNVHNTLQQGLRELGVTVDTLNSGDGFKNFHSDMKPLVLKNEFAKKYYNYLFGKWLLHKYDVIQFMGESEWRRIDGLNANAGVMLAKNARLSVLLLAGCNWEYARYSKEKLGISPCQECIEYDLKKRNHKGKRSCEHFYNKGSRRNQYAMQKTVDIMVPMAYEYYICSKHGPFAEKVIDPICMPIKVKDCHLTKPERKKKLLIYHPLNREGFKGTAMIRKAFEILQRKYENVAEFLIAGKMPYEEYTKLMDRVDVVVDQKNGMTFGMTSLQAMANRKILITGNYRAGISDPNYQYIKGAPAFELGTTVDEMVNNISAVIDKREDFEDLEWKGVEYVKKHHDHKKVAQEFLNLYERHLR